MEPSVGPQHLCLSSITTHILPPGRAPPSLTRPKSAAGLPTAIPTMSSNSKWTSASAAYERTSYRFRPGTPFPGVALQNKGVIQDIIPDQRVVTASTMSLGEHRISSALVTVEFVPNSQGSDLVLTHQGAFYEGSDGPKMREGGWRKPPDEGGGGGGGAPALPAAPSIVPGRALKRQGRDEEPRPHHRPSLSRSWRSYPSCHSR